MKHMDDDGNIKPCRAQTPEKCGYYRGEHDQRHYDTDADGYADVERVMMQSGEQSTQSLSKTSRLTDIAPQEQWDESVAHGYVDVFYHPNGELRGFNYSKAAQHEGHWDETTIAARGLIVNSNDEVVARPFSKFFNYGELSDDDMGELRGPVCVSDKLDGSLGIGYVDPQTGELNIATRGSFTSDQAQHATELYQQYYAGTWTPESNRTYMWEIIYPENRIVLDYGDTDDLMLVGKVNNTTGKSYPLSDVTEWNGRKADVLEHHSLSDAVNAPPRENAEGVVVHFPETDARVKLKQDDYVRLHRVATNLTTKQIWRAERDGADMEAWVQDMPEEFSGAVRNEIRGMRAQRDQLKHDAHTTYNELVNTLPPGFTQKEFAQSVQRYDKSTQHELFMIHTGKEHKLDKHLWERVYPEDSQISW